MSVGQPTLYDVLGCSPSNSREQITTEYRKRSLLVHPDKSNDPAAHEEFEKINNAYSILSDYTKRREYDLWLERGSPVDFDTWCSLNLAQSLHWKKQSRLSLESLPSPSPNYSTLSAEEMLRKFRSYEIG